MGALSVTDDLKILDKMPTLPTVDIVLIIGTTSHPLLDKECLEQLQTLVLR